MSSNYRFAVCDDQSIELNYLSTLVKRWANNNNTSVQIDTFMSAEAFLFQYETQKDYDILLLDIEMTGMDGVSLAKKIRQENETVQIIFVTGYSEYIAEGYEVAALHFLIKPVKEDKLFAVLNRAVSKIHKNERTLSISFSDETILIPFYEIKYLEVSHNYVTIHAKADYTIKKTLGEFEAELDDRFYRAGRSFLINLFAIERVTKQEVILKDASRIPLPRGQYDALNREIIDRM